MVGNYLFKSWIPGVLGWVVLYTVQVALAVLHDRWYHGGVREHLDMEGDYPQTKWYGVQRTFTSSFVMQQMWMSAGLYVVWEGSRLPNLKPWYPLVLGGALLYLCASNLRLARAVILYRAILVGVPLSGKVIYSRALVLRQGVGDLLTFAVFCLLLAALGQSYFFLGGAISCVVMARRYGSFRQVFGKAKTGA